MENSAYLHNRISGLLIAAVLGACWFVYRHIDQQHRLDVELITTAYQVDTAKVKSLLESHANPNARLSQRDVDRIRARDPKFPVTSNKWTALLALAHSESQLDPTPVATALLEAGADINTDDGYGETALGHCCYMNRERLALFLIKQGANPNTQTRRFFDGTYHISPAHRATQNHKILEALIAHGADLSVVDSEGESVLDWARGADDPRVAELVQQALDRSKR